MCLEGFPIFDGVSGELRPWISWLEDFFVQENFTADEKLNLAHSLLEGEAHLWFQRRTRVWGLFDSWGMMELALLLRFGDKDERSRLIQEYREEKPIEVSEKRKETHNDADLCFERQSLDVEHTAIANMILSSPQVNISDSGLNISMEHPKDNSLLSKNESTLMMGYGDGLVKLVEIPIFNGVYPCIWISKVQRFFCFYQNNDVEKISLVSLHLEGDDLSWFTHVSFTNWKDFKSRLYVRFGNVKPLSPSIQTSDNEVILVKDSMQESDSAEEEHELIETGLGQQKALIFKDESRNVLEDLTLDVLEYNRLLSPTKGSVAWMVQKEKQLHGLDISEVVDCYEKPANIMTNSSFEDHLFDIMLLRRYNLLWKRHELKSSKTWKFKFKDRNLVGSMKLLQDSQIMGQLSYDGCNLDKEKLMFCNNLVIMDYQRGLTRINGVKLRTVSGECTAKNVFERFHKLTHIKHKGVFQLNDHASVEDIVTSSEELLNIVLHKRGYFSVWHCRRKKKLEQFSLQIWMTCNFTVMLWCVRSMCVQHQLYYGRKQNKEYGYVIVYKFRIKRYDDVWWSQIGKVIQPATSASLSLALPIIPTTPQQLIFMKMKHDFNIQRALEQIQRFGDTRMKTLFVFCKDWWFKFKHNTSSKDNNATYKSHVNAADPFLRVSSTSASTILFSTVVTVFPSSLQLLHHSLRTSCFEREEY